MKKILIKILIMTLVFTYSYTGKYDISSYALNQENQINMSSKTNIKQGVVSVNGTLNVRKGPSTKYEIITRVYNNDTVDILESNNGWYKIKTKNNTIGWSSSKYIKETISNSENVDVSNLKKGTVKVSGALNVRKGPSTKYSVIAKVYNNNTVYILESSNGWYKVKLANNIIGWVSGKYIVENNITSSNNNTTSNNADSIIEVAYKQLGKPYVWGGNGPNSFDCSGLMAYAYKHGANINLPRTSRQQGDTGVSISKSQLQPADLIFFSSNGNTITHVGMYVGDGKMIHAPSNGQDVRIESIYSSYYTKTYVKSKRIL